MNFGNVLPCLILILPLLASNFDETCADVTDYLNRRELNDADVERIYRQWEEDEEQLPEDELPEHERKPPSIDFSKLDTSNPEQLLKTTKKGQTLMVFVSVVGDNKDETERITQLWQTSLWNNNVHCDRFLINENRAIFMFKDGAVAWEAKDFLVSQNECVDVTIENKVYDGKGKKESTGGRTEL